MSQAKRRTGRHPLAYMGVEPLSPLEFTIQDRDPATHDYSNWNIGALWLYQVGANTYRIWMLVEKTGLVATWIQLNGGDLETLTGDTGGAVGADLNRNINVVSGFAPLSVDGTPGTFTLTVNSDGTIPVTFTTDAGNGTAAAGTLNVAGGTGISTSAVGNTVTVSLSGNVATSFPTDSGTAIPAAGVLTIAGGLNIDTSGAGSTVTIATPTLAEGIVYVNGSGVYTSLGTADDGEVLIGDTGGTPAWANITSTGGSVTVTNGPNTINLEASGSGIIDVAFSAYNSVTDTNVTGNGTQYNFVCDTEVLDQGADYNNTTGIFTAPETGYYMIGAGVTITGHIANGTFLILGLVDSSAVDYILIRDEAENEITTSTFNGSVMVSLTANDTIKPYVTVTGEASDNTDVVGASDPRQTYFWGYKLPI